MMTDRIRQMRDELLRHRHHHFRRDVAWNLAEQFAAEKRSGFQRVSLALEAVLRAENPVFLPGERIVFTRTVRQLPELFTAEEWVQMRREHSFAEKGVVFNLCCDFGTTIERGLEARRAEIVERLRQSAAGIDFLTAALRSVDAVSDFSERYRLAAKKAGSAEVAEVLGRIPRQGAKTFREALQFLRILHYILWCEGEYHNGFGRFDQYMLPYLEHDLQTGIETESSAMELLQEFFLSCHRDSDLYVGV